MKTTIDQLVVQAVAAFTPAYKNLLRDLQRNDAAIYGLLPQEIEPLKARVALEQLPASDLDVLRFANENTSYFSEKLSLQTGAEVSPADLVRFNIADDVKVNLNEALMLTEAEVFAAVDINTIHASVDRVLQSAKDAIGHKPAELTAMQYSIRDFRETPGRDTLATVLSDIESYLTLLNRAGHPQGARELREIAYYAAKYPEEIVP